MRSMEKMMKKINVILLSLGLITGSSVYAGSCEVPKFLKIGGTYFPMHNKDRKISLKILEIDNDACWIKAKRQDKTQYRSYEPQVVWLNLQQIEQIILVTN